MAWLESTPEVSTEQSQAADAAVGMMLDQLKREGWCCNLSYGQYGVWIGSAWRSGREIEQRKDANGKLLDSIRRRIMFSHSDVSPGMAIYWPWLFVTGQYQTEGTPLRRDRKQQCDLVWDAEKKKFIPKSH